MLKINITKPISKREISQLGEHADDIIKSEVSTMVNSVLERNIPVEVLDTRISGIVNYSVNVKMLTQTEILQMYHAISSILTDEQQRDFNNIFNAWLS